MPTKHSVTDSRGKVHTRTSADRVYSHAIIAHYPARPAHGQFKARGPVSTSCWASRLDLAEKEARSLRKHGAESVEVIEAVTEGESRRQRSRALAEDRKRQADRVDGYDRDDLGESPDY